MYVARSQAATSDKRRQFTAVVSARDKNTPRSTQPSIPRGR